MTGTSGMSAPSRDRYLAKLRRLGHLSFQERLEALFDPGSCRLVEPGTWDAAWEEAVVTATGLVAGRPAHAYATNFLVDEGTLGEAEALRVVRILQRAVETGAPVVALLQSNGARVSERYSALAGNARLFAQVTRMSGTVPQIAACLGLCLGVAAYLASLADFAWMIPGQSYTATTSPAVIKVATGQSVSLEDLGGAALHASASGVAHFTARDERACIAGIRDLLGFLAPRRNAVAPTSELLAPPIATALAPASAPATTPATAPAPPAAAPSLDPADVIPASPSVPFDIRRLLEAVFDTGSFLEVHEAWAQSIVTGFARLGGRPIALVANQSRVNSGAIDTGAARKASRFVQTADAYGLPLIYFVDVPGIMVSTQEERAGILDAGGILFHAVDTTVPRLAVVVRKCFGGAFVMLQARQAGGDRVFAYPGAQIGIAGPEATFAILHGKEHQMHPDASRFKKDTLSVIRTVPTDAAEARKAGIVDRIIEPRATREELIAALAEIGERPRRERISRPHPVLQV